MDLEDRRSGIAWDDRRLGPHVAFQHPLRRATTHEDEQRWYPGIGHRYFADYTSVEALPGVDHRPHFAAYGERKAWRTLAPGQAYLVIATRKGGLPKVPTMLAAAVLKFVRYEGVSEEELTRRDAHIDFYETAKYSELVSVDADDDNDDLTNRTRELRLRAAWIPVFAAIDDPTTTYKIDAFSPLVQIPCAPGATVEIRSLLSTGWDYYSTGGYYSPRPDLVAASKARLREWRQRLAVDLAVLRIQRAWRAALFNPHTPLGKKRLLEEFAKLAEFAEERVETDPNPKRAKC